MKNYFIKTPWWLRKLYASYLWRVPTKEKILYLTFDDGPHPAITPFVLEELEKYQASATFFCIGKNVAAWPAVYRQVLDAGHKVGNHSYYHLNGWKTADEKYLEDIAAAARYIDSALFRPPYGRITSFQAKNLPAVLNHEHAKVVMWDVLSADFDVQLSPQKCAEHVLFHARPGSIVVFHDSEKAFPRLRESLPMVLHFFAQQGYQFKNLGGIFQQPD
jgi:peptidoglycan/xylan/chitin deacetylase (PgdA/CDA1 family)